MRGATGAVEEMAGEAETVSRPVARRACWLFPRRRGVPRTVRAERVNPLTKNFFISICVSWCREFKPENVMVGMKWSRGEGQGLASELPTENGSQRSC
jgi:hypothetical protein